MIVFYLKIKRIILKKIIARILKMMLKIKILMFYLWSVIVYICIFTNLPNVFSTILFQNIAFIENNHSNNIYNKHEEYSKIPLSQLIF